MLRGKGLLSEGFTGMLVHLCTSKGYIIDTILNEGELRENVVERP